MHKIPGIYQDIVPSSLTLWEDFAAVHKMQTPYIHFEVRFMGLLFNDIYLTFSSHNSFRGTGIPPSIP